MVKRKIKRMIVLLSCICIVGEHLPMGLLPQNTVYAANDIINFTETFDGAAKELATRWNYGSSVSVVEGWAILNSATPSMYLTEVEGAADWTDYVYEADVVMTEETLGNASTKIAAICGAVNTNNQGFEFGLMYKNSNYYVRLMDRAAGKQVGVGEGSSYVGQAPCQFTFGSSVRLKMEVVGNVVQCYVNEKKLITYEADTQTVLAGTIGICASGYQAKYDNISVKKADKGNITILDSKNNIVNSIQLFQGFEISPYDYTANVVYADGTECNVPMTVDMIGEFDNETIGEKNVLLTYDGVTDSIPVIISSRQDYVQEFVTKIENYKDTSEIVISDKTEIESFKEIYNSLSGYELSTIEGNIVTKYQQIVDTLYRMEHAELAEYDTIYVNDFNTKLVEGDWKYNISGASGTWRTFNGLLVNEQKRYGWDDKISYLAYSGFYGEVNSVEAEVMLTNEERCGASVLSCVSDSGYYHARIIREVKDYGIASVPVHKIQLYKYVGEHTLLVEKMVSAKIGEWYNLRLTTIDGRLLVYFDDTLVLEYDDSASSDCMTKGAFGFRSLYGDIKYDSLRVMGRELAVDEYEFNIEPTYYDDDFSDEVNGENPSHWIEETTSDDWKVYSKSDNLVYGTTSKDLAYTWLHTFESDPTVEMDFLVENIEELGRIEFLTRYTQAVYSYAGIGYDFEKEKWYIYSARGEDFEPQIVYAESTYDLNGGTWYTIKIQEEDTNVRVYVNDVLMLDDADIYMTGYGRIGLLSENVNLYVDNIHYMMPHGGNVEDGIIEYAFDRSIYGQMTHMEIEALDDNVLIGVNSNKRFLSYDKGLSWSKNQTEQYTEVRGKGLGYPCVLELSEGTYIMIYADTFEVYKSTDYMKSWSKIGQIISDIGDNKTDCGDWENIIHVNAVTKVTLSDGTVRIFLPVGMRRFGVNEIFKGHYTRIFYSDDNGATWLESKNDTRDITPNYTEDISTYFSWAESKVIQCSDGTLRLYNSRQYDCIVYTESYDGGITWEGLYSVPYLQNGQTSFGIAEDPENKGVYYMVCLNTNAESYNSTLPRNRLSLVKSTDGKNWEFVMDVERFTSYSNYLSSELYQILDPSISIIGDYMYITMGRSYSGGDSSSSHGEQTVRFVRIEMAKLPDTTSWCDANIANPTRPKTLEMETPPKVSFELGEDFTTKGGTVKLTAFNGNVTYESIDKFEMTSEKPDTNTKGSYIVTFMNRYAQSFSYRVYVEECYYDLFWETFDDLELMYSRWNQGRNVTIERRQAILDKDVSGMYVTGITDALGWTNYTYEADVVMTSEAYEKKNTQMAAICTAVNSDNQGYEFGLIYKNSKYYVRLFDRVAGNPVGTADNMTSTGLVPYNFTLGETAVRLKMEIRGNVIRCYADGVLLITYNGNTDENFTGTIGICASGYKAKFDNLSVTVEDYYDVSIYRSGSAYKNPNKEGHVFAGWYQDAAFTKPLDTTVKEGKAFAKFVDDDVLKILCQLPVGAKVEDDTINLRILTSVDSGQYTKVGFTVSVGKVKEFDFSDTTTIYERITAIEGKLGAFEYDAKTAFENNDSRYFMAHTLLGIPSTVFDETITIVPMWTTLDGTRVEGKVKTFKIEDELIATNSILKE